MEGTFGIVCEFRHRTIVTSDESVPPGCITPARCTGRVGGMKADLVTLTVVRCFGGDLAAERCLAGRFLLAFYCFLIECPCAVYGVPCAMYSTSMLYHQPFLYQ